MLCLLHATKLVYIITKTYRTVLQPVSGEGHRKLFKLFKLFKVTQINKNKQRNREKTISSRLTFRSIDGEDYVIMKS